jgi:UDP-N-acetylmuramate--alanine ligase
MRKRLDSLGGSVNGNLHFVGIGGSGMRSLARFMLDRGYRVSGCDIKDSESLTALGQLGAAVYVGHDPAHIADADAIIYSSSISKASPELAAARDSGRPMLHRSALLNSIMNGQMSVAIAGTHGKTTTSSMLAKALQAAGIDCSFVIGGDLKESLSGGHLGGSDVFVAEADESDGSFLLLAPTAGIITNVETEHVDRYASFSEVQSAFAEFLSRLKTEGFALLCADDPGARQLRLNSYAAPTYTYGFSSKADFRLLDLRLTPRETSFTLASTRDGHDYGRVQLPLAGTHNALNAAAAISAGLLLRLSFERLAAGVQAFQGARRRLQYVGEVRQIRVFDSYDHHPTEITALIGAVRQLAPGGRVLVAFQPHRYTRTQAFAAEFANALRNADVVIVTRIYGAGERPIPGVTGASIAELIATNGNVARFEREFSRIASLLADTARSGDVILTVGAGDIDRLAPQVLRQLGKKD